MKCQVRLFGPTSVRLGERRVDGTAFGGNKPRQVLALLALSEGRPLGRDELADQLWEGRPPAGHVTTLQGYVCLLRRALAAIDAGPCLVTTHGGYLLDPDHVEVDLTTGRRLIRDGGLVGVLDGLEIASAGLLPGDHCTAWADRACEEWDRELAQAARDAAAGANRAGDHLAAIRLARAALARAPYSEGALRELMVALGAVGQPAEALRAFHVTRQQLRAELGVEPQQATSDLYVRLLGTTKGCAAADAPLLVTLLMDALRDVSRASATEQETWTRVGRMLLSRAG
jgi:DNA-binding SARP family transcriptional activator